MYRTIDASFWTDPVVRELDHTTRYFFLYLVTNPHTHVSGLYYLPRLIAQHETGLSNRQIGYGIDTLSSVRRCLFDAPNSLVWVVNMFDFQGHGKKNTLSAAYHLAEDIHNSFLIHEFIERYPQVKKPYLKRVSDRVSRVGTPDPDSRSLIPDPEQEQKKRSRSKKSNTESPSVPERRTNGQAPKDYQQYWGPVEQYIRKNVEAENFKRYYSGIEVIGMTSKEIILAVPGAFIQDRCTGDPKIAATALTISIEHADSDFMRGRRLKLVTLEEQHAREHS